MVGHVGEGFLGYPEQGHLDRRAQRHGVTCDIDLHVDVRAFGPSLGQVAQRLRQVGLIEFRRPEGLDRAAGLGQTVLGQAQGAVHVRPGPLGRVPYLLCRMYLGDDPSQALGEGVMDLPCHALPLVEHSGLTCLGQQLGVQPGVLLQRRFQFLHRLVALPIVFDPFLGEQDPDADRRRLDGDHTGIGRDRLGRQLGETQRHRVERHRRAEHPRHTQRPRPQQVGMEEAGDGEEQEHHIAAHQGREEHEQAGEVHHHVVPALAECLRHPRVPKEHPPSGGHDQAQRDCSLSPALSGR